MAPRNNPARLMRPRQRGFTLLEVLVAFVIAALALSVMFKAASGGLFGVVTAGKYEEAISRAKSHMAAIGRDKPITAGDSEGDDGSDFHWRLHIEQITVLQPSEALLRTIPLPTTREPALYAVESEVSWSEGGKTRRVLLRTKRIDSQVNGLDQ